MKDRVGATGARDKNLVLFGTGGSGPLRVGADERPLNCCLRNCRWVTLPVGASAALLTLMSGLSNGPWLFGEATEGMDVVFVAAEARRTCSRQCCCSP